MNIEALLMPVWKTRHYSFAINKLHGSYLIYLKRLGKYYMKNEQGVRVRFITTNPEEEEYYNYSYKNQIPILVVYE